MLRLVSVSATYVRVLIPHQNMDSVMFGHVALQSEIHMISSQRSIQACPAEHPSVTRMER